jgi:hypothetical protein
MMDRPFRLRFFFLLLVLVGVVNVRALQRLKVKSSHLIVFKDDMPRADEENVAHSIQEGDHYSIYLNAYGLKLQLLLWFVPHEPYRVIDENGVRWIKPKFWEGHVHGVPHSSAFGYLDRQGRFYGYFTSGNESYYLDRHPHDDEWEVIIYRKSDLVPVEESNFNEHGEPHVTSESITAELVAKLIALNRTQEAVGGVMPDEPTNSPRLTKKQARLRSKAMQQMHKKLEHSSTANDLHPDVWSEFGERNETKAKANYRTKRRLNRPRADYLHLVRVKRSAQAQKSASCGVELIADHTYTASNGNDERRTAQEMILVLHMSNDIFRATDFNGDNRPDGLSLRIAGVIVYKHTRYPWADTRFTVNQVLHAMGQHITSHCAVMTFLARDYKGVLGLAWLGMPGNPGFRGICSRPSFNPSIRGRSVSALNTGLITSVNRGHSRSRADVALTFAHELGHLFGAHHDNDPQMARNGWRCPTVNLMASHSTSISWKTSWQFSFCSTRQMKPVVESRGAACFGTRAFKRDDSSEPDFEDVEDYDDDYPV